MGKAQSKRSVDITTDPKKDATVDEGTGEMKKIEDVDQLKPQINGDTHHNENEEKEKVTENGETENEKDLSTEKENQKPQEVASTATASPDTGAGGDGAATASTANENTATPPTNEQSNTDANETLNDSKTAEETLGETPENSSKKPKKEKKKKWSFRSISFGKKDKQKPLKKDDTANNSAVNGECEKVLEENATEETKVIEENKDSSSVAEISATPVEVTKNLTEENTSTTVESEVKVEKLETPTIATEAEKSDEVVTNGSGTEPKTVELVKSSDESSVSVPEEKEQKLTIANVPLSNESSTNDIETKQEEIKNSSSLTNGVEHHDADEAKLNGGHESTKIEVKSEENSSVEKNYITEISNSNNEPNANDIILSSETEKSINNVQISTHISNIISKDDDNDSLNLISKLPSSPPPPLPCSPPPSQVMVFALSETKQEQQTIDDEITKNENADLKEKIISDSFETKINTSLTNIVSKTENLENITNLNEIEDIRLINENNENLTDKLDLTIKSNENEPINISEIDDTVLKLEITTEKNKTETTTEIGNASSEVIATNIVEEKLIATEKEVSDTKTALIDIINNGNSKIDKVECELKQITTDLDEIANENTTSELEAKASSETDKTDKTVESANVKEDSMNNLTSHITESTQLDDKEIPLVSFDLLSSQDNYSPIENNTSIDEIATSQENNKQTENNTAAENEIIEEKNIISTTALNLTNTVSNDIEKYSDKIVSASKNLIESDNISAVTNNEENICIDNENEIKELSIEQELPPPPTPSSLIVLKSGNLIENKSENDDLKLVSESASPSENIISTVKETIEEIKSDNGEQSDSASELTTSATSHQQNVPQLEKDITSIATNNDNNAPSNQKKENGIDDNHDELAEVSATESLNGVDHKTIEDIKSENQQIEKVVGTDVITQGATATVAE